MVLNYTQMRKLIIRSGILLVFITTLALQSYSQITVSKVENNNIGSTISGFYYSLPQTVLKIDIAYEKLQSIKGPLSDYTNEFLGEMDYITSGKVEYNPMEVSVTSIQDPDPNQLYFVQFPAERTKDAKPNSFILSDMGGILAYNTEVSDNLNTSNIRSDQTIIFKEGETNFPYMSQYNKQKKIDTVVRTINIDTITINRFLFNTTWVDKNARDKANDAAVQIEKIRESRYNLISGYQEVNYGSSIIYMDQQLQEMENKYLELFLGKTIRTIEKRTIYFIPNKNNKSEELMKFTDGSSVVIRLVPDNTSNKISNNNGPLTNSMYYRVPSSADITISSNNINLFTGRLVINQFGHISSAPLENTKLQFDYKSGNLINISRD